MKSKIGGIDIRANGSYCCEMYNGEWSVVLASQSDFNRNLDREWQGLSDALTLLTHEVRHVDGFGHVGGCPLFPTQPFGCDQTYNENNLAAYGVQWWLHSQWLSGGLNVGIGCLSEFHIITIANSHISRNNNDFRKRFVDNAPPVLSMPAFPGGLCPGTTTPPTQPPTPTQTLTPTPPPTLPPTPPPTPPPTATPTPPPTPPITPTPTPPTATPRPLIQGDVDCNGAVSSVDALKLMRHVAHMAVSQNEPCPDIGTNSTWGDVDCDGAITAVDALKVLRVIAGKQVLQSEPCPDIGTPA
jgi:hypothetical protein